MSTDTNMPRAASAFLRFVAIVLVINSHMDEFYPYPWLATGGAIGNSLFFMLSAYGLLMSEQSYKQSFTEYYVKRVKRIYPAVWINIVCLIIPTTILYYFTSPYWYEVMLTEFNFGQPLLFMSVIFYPPPAFWFLDALMLFYILGFLFLKNYSPRKLIVGLSLLLVFYVASYLRFSDYSSLVIESTLSFKMIFYAMVFLSGIYFASIDCEIVYQGKRDYFVLLALLLAIYGHKILMLKGATGEFQFIEQMLIFPLLYYFIKISKSPFILYRVMKPSVVSGFISVVAAMTLELYMSHGALRILIHQYVPQFPANVIVHLLLTLSISYGLYKLSQYILVVLLNKSLSDVR